MEKMFVYPEALDSRVALEMFSGDDQPAHSRADVASHRCKLYRTLLEQRTASHQARVVQMDHERATDNVYA